jgi:hypothetical protein
MINQDIARRRLANQLRTHVLRPTWHFLMPEDIRWLLDLTAPRIKAAMAHGNRHLGLDEGVEGTSYWSSASEARSTEPAPAIILLPNYDEYLVGYEGYGAIFNGLRLAPNALNSLLTHAIVRDGHVAGAWSRTLRKSEVNVVANLLVDLNEAERDSVRLSAEAYGRFLGLGAAVEFR